MEYLKTKIEHCIIRILDVIYEHAKIYPYTTLALICSFCLCILILLLCCFKFIF